MIQFNTKYFALAIFLFLIEVLIAVYVDDSIVRPYVGDLLVVILLYCMVRSVVKAKVWKIALVVLVFSFAIEILQYFHFVRLVGLRHSKLANVIMGNTFQWIDLAAYTAGIGIVLGAERLWSKVE